MKRSRIGSASTVEDNKVNYVIPQWQYHSGTMPAPTNGGVTQPANQQSSGGPCCLSSEGVDVVCRKSDRYGVYLEHCCYCKKKILVTDPVYMYSGYAFCTTECREIQILADEAKEEGKGKRKVSVSRC